MSKSLYPKFGPKVPNIYVEVKYEQMSVMGAKTPRVYPIYIPKPLSYPFPFLRALQSRHKVIERRSTQLGGADVKSIQHLSETPESPSQVQRGCRGLRSDEFAGHSGDEAAATRAAEVSEEDDELAVIGGESRDVVPFVVGV